MTEIPAFKNPASFRDPSGFVFEKDAKVYRHVAKKYAAHYLQLQQSGLYDLLAGEGRLISHSELQEDFWNDPEWFITLGYERIPFLSYPYEWCFSAWKDAALLTLDIAILSLDHNMLLKDATPFNIQFIKGRPVFIDTLSFENFRESTPWIAYRQFIETFAAPLLLMQYAGLNASALFKSFPEGIPVALLSKLLPFKTRFRLNTWLHVHLHARLSRKNGGARQNRPFSKQKMLQLFQNLRSWIYRMEVRSPETSWSNYYEKNILNQDYLSSKEKIISEWLAPLSCQSVCDLGANDGHFSKLAAANSSFVIACDSDPLCIENLYKDLGLSKTENILPVVADIVNPSPASGWNNEERKSFIERCRVDLLMALALVHHLAIGNNVPFEKIAALFSKLCRFLVIEFVPKDDEKTILLLKDREDIFPGYTIRHFEESFARYFSVIKKDTIPHSGRTVYLMENLYEPGKRD